ncbi:MAG TPA: hypothetical protein VEK57_14910 [Thermoanaerobaculia bacterium]|nr:hypothetical protein [Thermoanaerobaculia bacterium]
MRRLVLLLVMVSAVAAGAQERFVNRDLNYSVIAPSGWRWTEVAKGQTWVAQGPRGERFTVYASQPSTSRIDESWLKELLPALARDAGAHSARIEHYMQKRATSPIFPSVRYAYTRVAADGKKTFVDGWVACSGRIYSLEYSSPSRESMPEFQSFVRSFQIVDKFASQRSARASQAQQGLKNGGAATDILGRPIAPNQGSGVIR